VAQRLSVYLDQNKWIELLRAENDVRQGGQTRDVLNLIKIGVSSGSLVVPLSAAHYLETWNRKDWNSRHALAAIMREVSGFCTLAPVQKIADWEIERLLLANFRGPNCACEPPDIASLVLGRGVEHAFGSATGRLRILERIAQGDIPEGSPVQISSELQNLLAKVRSLPNDAYEWWSLAGFEDSLEYDDWETRSEHRLGTERVLQEEGLAQRLSDDKYLRGRLGDYLIAEEMGFACEEINRIAFWHGANTDLLIKSWLAKGPAYGRSLVEALPTRSCIIALRKAKHSNPQWKWQQHDQTDIAALSAAVPYCDAVVTERQWAHVFHHSHLDAQYNTRVLSKLDDLLPLLAAALE
jgi:hypothetical protein